MLNDAYSLSYVWFIGETGEAIQRGEDGDLSKEDRLKAADK